MVRKTTKAKTTKGKKRYYSRGVPRRTPHGKVVCHGSVFPILTEQSHGDLGFRVWRANRAWLDEHADFKRCRCGWAPHLREHYSPLTRQQIQDGLRLRQSIKVRGFEEVMDAIAKAAR